jgi:hypothetical protein
MNRITLCENIVRQNYAVKTSSDGNHQVNLEAPAGAQAAYHISDMDGYAATRRFDHERHT